MLVMNCGSSLLKFSFFDGEERVQSGLVERLGEADAGAGSGGCL